MKVKERRLCLVEVSIIGHNRLLLVVAVSASLAAAFLSPASHLTPPHSPPHIEHGQTRLTGYIILGYQRLLLNKQ